MRVRINFIQMKVTTTIIDELKENFLLFQHRRSSLIYRIGGRERFTPPIFILPSQSRRMLCVCVGCCLNVLLSTFRNAASPNKLTMKQDYESEGKNCVCMRNASVWQQQHQGTLLMKNHVAYKKSYVKVIKQRRDV